MKTKLIIFTLLFSSVLTAQFNQDDELFLVYYVDPTVEDPGAQHGLELTKELQWAYTSIGVSVYPELKPYYADLVGTVGINYNINKIRAYAGLRMGVIHRGDGYSPNGLLGGVIGADVEIFEGFSIGGRFWLDKRGDQHKLGDPTNFEGGILGIQDHTIRENFGLTARIKI